jgi:branched-chain amino acid transport system substrate-binding protein
MKITLLISLILFVNTIFAQTDTIKIGVFADYTGQTSSFGISSFSGIKMAVEQINAAGGINGKKLEIIIGDGGGQSENTKTVVKKLIEEDKVDVLIGEPTSTGSIIGANIAQLAKVPMITPSGTNPKITEVGDFIFRTCFVDLIQGEVMAKYAFETLKLKRVSMLVDFGSDYSKGLADSFTTAFKKLGGSVVSRTFYSGNDEEFGSQLATIRRFKPQAIYIPGYYNQVGEIAREVRANQMKVTLLGGDGWDSPTLFELGGSTLNNSFITNNFATTIPTENVKTFVAGYKKLYNLDPDSFAALGYDSANLLADALKRANSTDKQKLRDALAATKNFQGITGKITFDANRNPRKSVYILKIDQGKFVYNSTIEP